MSQDVVLFDDTVAANIAYGSMRNVGRAEIESAASGKIITLKKSSL